MSAVAIQKNDRTADIFRPYRTAGKCRSRRDADDPADRAERNGFNQELRQDVWSAARPWACARQSPGSVPVTLTSMMFHHSDPADNQATEATANIKMKIIPLILFHIQKIIRK